MSEEVDGSHKLKYPTLKKFGYVTWIMSFFFIPYVISSIVFAIVGILFSAINPTSIITTIPMMLIPIAIIIISAHFVLTDYIIYGTFKFPGLRYIQYMLDYHKIMKKY